MERSPILNLWHGVFGYQIILKPSSVAVGMMQNHAIVVYSHLVITPYLAFWHSHLQVHPLIFPYLDLVTLLQPACFWWNDHLFWAKSLGICLFLLTWPFPSSLLLLSQSASSIWCSCDCKLLHSNSYPWDMAGQEKGQKFLCCFWSMSLNILNFLNWRKALTQKNPSCWNEVKWKSLSHVRLFANP